MKKTIIFALVLVLAGVASTAGAVSINYYLTKKTTNSTILKDDYFDIVRYEVFRFQDEVNGEKITCYTVRSHDVPTSQLQPTISCVK